MEDGRSRPSTRKAADTAPDEAAGWPIQARFWLEWGLFNLPNPVIPTGAEHRESGALRSGGTLCCDVIMPDQGCPTLVAHFATGWEKPKRTKPSRASPCEFERHHRKTKQERTRLKEPALSEVEGCHQSTKTTRLQTLRPWSRPQSTFHPHAFKEARQARIRNTNQQQPIPENKDSTSASLSDARPHPPFRNKGKRIGHPQAR